MCVLLEREYSQDILILMDRLSKISSFLLVRPVGIGVSELSLDRRRVDVTTVLLMSVLHPLVLAMAVAPCPGHPLPDSLFRGQTSQVSLLLVSFSWWKRKLAQLVVGGLSVGPHGTTARQLVETTCYYRFRY